MAKKTTKSKKVARRPANFVPDVILVIVAAVLILQYFIIDRTVSLDTTKYRLSVVGFWLGVVSLACFVTLMLKVKRRKK
jgi:formate-dependent nitrite reductase membrane component NrfD